MEANRSAVALRLDQVAWLTVVRDERAHGAPQFLVDDAFTDDALHRDAVAVLAGGAPLHLQTALHDAVARQACAAHPVVLAFLSHARRWHAGALSAAPERRRALRAPGRSARRTQRPVRCT